MKSFVILVYGLLLMLFYVTVFVHIGKNLTRIKLRQIIILSLIFTGFLGILKFSGWTIGLWFETLNRNALSGLISFVFNTAGFALIYTSLNKKNKFDSLETLTIHGIIQLIGLIILFGLVSGISFTLYDIEFLKPAYFVPFFFLFTLLALNIGTKTVIKFAFKLKITLGIILLALGLKIGIIQLLI